MSEETVEYQVKDKIDLRTHIEQECILGSLNRLKPIIEEAARKESLGEKVSSNHIKTYMELERLALDLARYALDYYNLPFK